LLPDLRSFAMYDANSNGTALDGSNNISSTNPGNAFRNLATNTFNDWTIGLRLAMPLGFRFAHAQLRQSQLQLARSFLVLQDQELKAERFLGLEYRRMSSAYFQIKAARAQRLAFATQLRVRYEKYRAGAQDATLDLLLEAQRFWADALATEYQSIVTYNNAICGWEFAKGTILQHDNVTISEGPIPCAAQKRAVEHLRQRTKALLLRERAAPSGVLAAPLERSGPINLYPQIRANSLPAIWKDAPPLKDAEELPSAQSIDPNKVDQLPDAVKETPMNEVFPQQELPDGVQLPSVKPSPAPAANQSPDASPSTFGASRPADSPMPELPINQAKPVSPPAPAPAESSVPLLEQSPSSPLGQMPAPSSPGLPEPIPAQTTTPLLPLTPNKN
jgi:hypothetical protein